MGKTKKVIKEFVSWIEITILARRCFLVHKKLVPPPWTIIIITTTIP
jgi:hypothetical protein